MLYNVYKVITTGGGPQDHHAIFVELNDDKSGWTFQVTGNVQQGMMHENKAAEKPSEQAMFEGQDYLGTVTKTKYPRVQQICESVPAPKKQYELNKRLYPKEPVRRCQEWTVEAIAALRAAGVLEVLSIP